jgi:hypothetical protein
VIKIYTTRHEKGTMNWNMECVDSVKRGSPKTTLNSAAGLQGGYNSTTRNSLDWGRCFGEEEL